jgi:hypothetical protein
MSFFDEAKKKLGQALGHPYVQKASLLGAEVLEITASLAHNKNPISIGGAMMAGANVLASAFDVAIESPLTYYLNKHDLKVYEGNLHKLLLKAGAGETFKVVTAFVSEDINLMRMDMGDSQYIYWNVTGKSIDSYDGLADTDNVASQYWTEADFNMQKVHDFFWAKFPTGIGLAYGKSSENAGRRGPDIFSLPPANLYSDSTAHPIADISQYISKSKELNISRSFLLYGQPGTGKTSWVERIAQEFANRIVKVDSSYLHAVSSTEIEQILSILSPQIVLFDDFDRIDSEHYEGQFLYITENLKRKYPKITFFATVNEPEDLGAALLRPGRFDEKLEFLLTESVDCVKIVKMYAKDHHLALSNDEIEYALGKTGFTPAECKEAISRKVLRPQLDLKDIFDNLLQYRGFGDNNSELKRRKKPHPGRTKARLTRKSKLTPESLE